MLTIEKVWFLPGQCRPALPNNGIVLPKVVASECTIV